MTNNLISVLPSADVPKGNSNLTSNANPVGNYLSPGRPAANTNDPRTLSPKLNTAPWSTSYAQVRTPSAPAAMKGKKNRTKRSMSAAMKGGKKS
jgi:hypothetical protein